ncbi:MAG: Uncharacterised protein [Flavobacteriia bacterium]|nr:MAG: Uncharacterised protein [Flavobacteriia bacterium]
MKKVLFSLLAMLVIGAGTVEASFPVKKSNKEQTVEATVDADLALVQGEVVADTSDAGGFDSDDWILLALWFFLGGFAAHRWYAKKPVGWNLLFILTLGGLGIWAIVDLIQILTQDFM